MLHWKIYVGAHRDEEAHSNCYIETWKETINKRTHLKNIIAFCLYFTESKQNATIGLQVRISCSKLLSAFPYFYSLLLFKWFLYKFLVLDPVGVPRSFTRRCVSYNTMMSGFVYMEGLMRAMRHINCLKKCPRRILFVMWYATLICNEGKIVESLNLILRLSDSGLSAISFLLFPPPSPKTLLKGEQRTFWRLVICFFLPWRLCSSYEMLFFCLFFNMLSW